MHSKPIKNTFFLALLNQSKTQEIQEQEIRNFIEIK